MDSLAEKYRPNDAEEILGQPNAALVFDLISSHVSPAYLFYGPAGTGKTSAAHVLASIIEGQPCHEVVQYTSDYIQQNCGMNGGVDDIKELILDKCQLPPRVLKHKYIVLDECQMLTTNSQNALLNIMETPPEYLVFILCTTEPRKLVQAVKSRCMQVKFLSGKIKEIQNKLIYVCQHESIAYDDKGLELISRAAQGSFRNALIILAQYQKIGATHDNVANYSGAIDRDLCREILQSCFTQDYACLTALADKVNKTSVQIEGVMQMLLEELVYLVKCKALDKDDELLQMAHVPLLKLCDIVLDTLKSMSPATPESLAFSTMLFKLSAKK